MVAATPRFVVTAAMVVITGIGSSRGVPEPHFTAGSNELPRLRGTAIASGMNTMSKQASSRTRAIRA